MTNRLRGFMWLVLLLIMALAASFLPTSAQTPTPLHEAVAEGLVLGEILASASAFGELSLTLNPSGDPLMIVIPPGTRFIADDTLSEVISLKQIEMLIQGETRIDPLPVAALVPDKPGPSPNTTTEYKVGGMVEGPLLSLLERLQARETPDDYAAQLAIWAVHQGRSVADIVAVLNTPPPAADAAAAAELVAGLPTADPADPADPAGPAETDESSATAEPNPPAETGSKEEGISLGAIAIGALALVGIVIALAAGVTLANRKHAPAESEESVAAVAPAVPPVASRPARPAPVPPSPPAKPRPQRTDTVSIDLSAPLVLLAANGQKLPIGDDTLVSRLSVPVQALRHAGLSSPHVYLYWTDNDVQVRDLNTEGGTSLNGRPLGRERTDAPFGGTLTLAGGVTLILQRDGIQVGDRFYPAPSGDMIISREPLAVLALGDDDRGISIPHCLIKRGGDDLVVRDLNSSNGVLIDGKKIGSDEQVIRPGGVLQLGKTTLSRSDG